MMKVLRTVLFWLARVAGVIGLVAGGKSLGTYALARLKDPYFDSFSYNDLVFSGGVIFLLSLLVLIAAEVGHGLDKHFRLGKVEGSAGPANPAVPAHRPAPSIPTPASRPGSAGDAERESADEKLARLLKQKSE